MGVLCRRRRRFGRRQRGEIPRRHVAQVVVAELLRHCVHDLVLAHAFSVEHELELQIEVGPPGQVRDILAVAAPPASRPHRRQWHAKHSAARPALLAAGLFSAAIVAAGTAAERYDDPGWDLHRRAVLIHIGERSPRRVKPPGRGLFPRADYPPSRQLLAVVPDPIDRAGLIVRDQERAIHRVDRHIARATPVLVVLDPTPGERLLRDVLGRPGRPGMRTIWASMNQFQLPGLGARKMLFLNSAPGSCSRCRTSSLSGARRPDVQRRRVNRRTCGPWRISGPECHPGGNTDSRSVYHI